MGKRGFISANNALFVSVDLIGEKNQVILEWFISLTTFLLLGDFTSKEDWEMRSILSFVFDFSGSYRILFNTFRRKKGCIKNRIN